MYDHAKLSVVDLVRWSIVISHLMGTYKSSFKLKLNHLDTLARGLHIWLVPPTFRWKMKLQWWGPREFSNFQTLFGALLNWKHLQWVVDYLCNVSTLVELGRWDVTDITAEDFTHNSTACTKKKDCHTIIYVHWYVMLTLFITFFQQKFTHLTSLNYTGGAWLSSTWTIPSH